MLLSLRLAAKLVFIAEKNIVVAMVFGIADRLTHWSGSEFWLIGISVGARWRLAFTVRLSLRLGKS